MNRFTFGSEKGSKVVGMIVSIVVKDPGHSRTILGIVEFQETSGRRLDSGNPKVKYMSKSDPQR